MIPFGQGGSFTVASLESTTLGKTGIPVTNLGLGTAQLGGGGIYELLPESQGSDTAHRAFSAGIRLIDAAPFYGAGIAEERLGRILRTLPREEITLASKVGRLVTGPGAVTFDFSREGVLRSIDESLRRLQVDRLDIVHIHDPDAFFAQAVNEAFPALAELREQGMIGAIGVGMTQWEMPLAFLRETTIDCMVLAGRYTLLEQGGALEALLPECERRGIGVMLGGIYNSGILATGSGPGARYEYRNAPPEILERVDAIDAVCIRHGVPLQVAAVQFPLAHPAVSSILVGMVSVEEVDALIRAIDFDIPVGLWDDLRAERLIAHDAPTPG
jgi:D-threo-aldose 1-dehydrogenase